MYICDVLLIKTFREYSVGDFEAMTNTLLRLLAYEEVFSDRYTQIDYYKRRSFQGKIYDAIFTYDLLRPISEASKHRFCEIFYRGSKETQFAEVIRNDTIDYLEPHLDNKYRTGMMKRTLGQLYRLNSFKKKEGQHIRAYAQHVADFLTGGKSYSEYQTYELPGGYWLPGRVYAQDMIDTYDALVKHEFSWNNRSLVLLWALLIHSHYRSTGVLPESLADAWSVELVAEMPRTTSITTGADLVYMKEDGDFRIEGGTEYRSISGPDAQPESETIYAGCLK